MFNNFSLNIIYDKFTDICLSIASRKFKQPSTNLPQKPEIEDKRVSF